MIPVYKPYLPPNSLRYAHEALDSTWLSSQGKYIQMATEKLQELLNVPYVIPLNNGTSACHLLAKCLYRARPPLSGTGWQAKKKLIVPNNVYVAAWNAFLFDQQYQLIPVDADVDTWNVDLQKLDTTLTKFPDAEILIVHNVGNIVDVPALQRKYRNTLFVEDNCEGFLGKYGTQYSGTVSLASAVSFFGNKNITSGEGGAFITRSEEAYLYAKCIQGQGQSEKRFVHSELGYNYRMTNVQAAILCGQMELLPQIQQMKHQVFTIYRQAFQDREDVKVQQVPPNTEHSNWMFGIRIINNTNYDTAEDFFRARGIEIRPMFYSISAHTHISNNHNVFMGQNNVATLLNRECFILPSYPELTEEDQSHIIHGVNTYIKTIRKIR